MKSLDRSKLRPIPVEIYGFPTPKNDKSLPLSPLPVQSPVLVAEEEGYTAPIEWGIEGFMMPGPYTSPYTGPYTGPYSSYRMGD